ncbi:MAG: hypothetical protein C4307_02260 [Chloroflexota bacterium]
MRRALLLVSLLALVLPGLASAHATLERTAPPYQKRLSRAPAQVVLAFNQRVRLLPGSVRVYDAAGRLRSGRPRLSATGRAIVTPLLSLPRGGYTVRWHALSAGDGHVVAGVFTFGVRAAAPEPDRAYGAAGPGVAEYVVRWLYFAGLSLVLGGLAFRLVLLPGPLPRLLERRFYLVQTVALVSVLETGIAAFLLRGDDALQVPFTRFLYSDLSAIARTDFGSAFIAMTLGFACVLALVFLAWLTDKRWLLWPALVLSLGLASGLSLSGHSASEPNSSLWSRLADWAHVSAASLWTGGLATLLLVFLAAPELRRVAFARFARLAPVFLTVLVAAGVYLTILRLPRLADLWQTGYGRVLVVKLSLVVLALAWGGVHHFLVRPRLERPGVLSRLPHSLAGESAVGMAVLLLAAILVNSSPPPVSPSQAPAQAASAPPLRGHR